MSEALPCKSCGSVVIGRYCSACGERVLTPDDHTLKHYLGALLNAFTFADSKFWNTLKAVVLRPGELSAAYMAGQRVKYMRPVAFFFLANFIYFAFPVFQTFNTSLEGHMRYMPYRSWANAAVEQHLEGSGETLDAFTARYTPASANNAKLMLVLMVFLLVLPVGLLYARKRAYFSAHVTAAFELMAFHVWVSTIVLGTVFGLLVFLLNSTGLRTAFMDADSYLSVPLILLHMWVTIGIGHRFFGCTWAGSMWRALAMLFGLQFALSAYRALLFAVTFWQVS
ncbi:MAG: DUF3667 domain-containing protein [Flavobacteriales bacterium]|nr:DUF3667 domain-containing protein [Flavobacteriales bacterium]